MSFVFYLKKQTVKQAKTLPKQGHKDFSPVFSSRSFIFLALASRGMTHFELIFVYGVGEVSKFICIFSTTFVKKAIFFSLKYLGTFLENQLTIFIWVCFWSMCSVPLIICLSLCQYYTLLITAALESTLKSVSVKFSNICSFFKDVLIVPGSLHFHIDFIISF